MGVYQKTIGPLTAVPIRRLDPLLLLGLAALLLLLLPGLDLPIRDWDEGIVARVAYERSQALLQFSQGELSWHDLLLPTYWAEPYLNKPPGLHLPAGLAYFMGRLGDLPPPWAVRLCQPFGQCCGAAGRADQSSAEPQTKGAAIAAAAIALTLLP